MLVLIATLCAGCGTTPERRADRAADRLLDLAETEEDRVELELARDRAIAEMREEAEALDAEIRRLREENTALRKRLERSSERAQDL